MPKPTTCPRCGGMALRDNRSLLCDDCDMVIPLAASRRERVAGAIGNVLDRWEQLPNDIRTDVGFEDLERALSDLNSRVTEEQ